MGSTIAACRLLAALALTLAALAVTCSAAAATARAKGLDVSHYQGSIAWSKVAGAGYRFVFGKATEGTTYTDPTYTTNRNGSEAAGLRFGGYHFARPSGTSVAAATASAVAQADRFLAVAAPQPGELPPVLDLEVTGSLPESRLVTWTLAWLGEIDARTGVRPSVYTSPNFWSEHLANSTAVAAAGIRLWVAHWTSKSEPLVPAQNWNGKGWTFWQWTNCVSVPGIAHCADADRLNGTNLAAVSIAPYPSGVPVLSTPPSIVGPPEAGHLLAAVPGTWQGGKPVRFSYQWKRCDTAGVTCVPIAGKTSEKYTPMSADVGHSLEVVATATSAAGSATAVTPPTSAVTPAGTRPKARPTNLALPQIVGTAQDGQTLTSSVGTWTGSPTKYTYRWRRCAATGIGCVAILHGTQAHYTLTPDDIGSTVSLVVTATGAGGAASATAPRTGVVVAAPLPPVSLGTQKVQRGVAGNIRTTDGRASVTWQPGAVPSGLTVSLSAFTGQLSVPGSEVALTVPGLKSTGFKWPLDLVYAQRKSMRTTLGYSTDGKVYYPVPTLEPPELPVGTVVGSYSDSTGLTHVLTRTPLLLAQFTKGGWGDPTFTSANGPALGRQSPFRVLRHPADHSILLLTRLDTHSQSKVSATVTRRGRQVVILGKGSRLGAPLARGNLRVARTERLRPSSFMVRLRLNARRLLRGRYTVRLAAVDPWGRRSRLTFHFRYP